MANNSFHPDFWHEAPFLRLLPPLIVGIFCQYYFTVNNLFFLLIPLCVFGSFILVWDKMPITIRFRYQWVVGVNLFLSLFVFGMAVTNLSSVATKKDFYGNFISNKNDLLTIKIIEPPVIRTNSFRANAEIISVGNHATEGNIVAYFHKGEDTVDVQYGDILIINNNLQEIKNAGNPGCFDYKRYCYFQNTFHFAFLKEKGWVKVGAQPNSFWSFIYDCRQKCVSILQTNINSPLEAGVCEALLIGDKDDLDKDLQQSYSNTGIVHILAISGMHLGLIFWLLNKVFFFLDKSRKTRLLKAIIVLSVMWIFSLLTGASGSVIRAAVMFTLILGSGVLQRKGNIYNTLAASAFFILCFVPFDIFDVGFQLSYIAVVGIVWLQRYPSNWLFYKDWIRKQIWNLIAVSLAAQTIAFPICIYYFHQFPNLFLPANLVAIPLSTAILFGEILLIVVSPIKIVAQYVGLCLKWMTWAMDEAVLKINNVPHSVTDNLNYSFFDTLLLYAVVLLFCFWLIKQQPKFLKYGLMMLAVICLKYAVDSAMVANERKIVVYNIPKLTAIDFINGSSFYERCDTEIQQREILKNFHIKPGHIKMGLEKNSSAVADFYQTPNAALFGNQFIFIADESVNWKTKIRNGMPVDYVIITHSPKISMHRFLNNKKPKQIIFDGSNKEWKVARWKHECDSMKINYWDTAVDGAWVQSI